MSPDPLTESPTPWKWNWRNGRGPGIEEHADQVAEAAVCSRDDALAGISPEAGEVPPKCRRGGGKVCARLSNQAPSRLCPGSGAPGRRL
ncbi:hypothetical protein ACFXGT_38005 [Streptomyces sp. NPDC059352]|uniref:hypothetical protein n=1 Tax=Streptomyces sp. NPDC059352 TaxID=3346810 RepID=UPI0036B746A2